MSQRCDTPSSEANPGIALPVSAVDVSAANGANFGWCLVDANKRVLAPYLSEKQARQMSVAINVEALDELPFARSEKRAPNLWACPHEVCAYPNTCRDAGHCIAAQNAAPQVPESVSLGAAPVAETSPAGAAPLSAMAATKNNAKGAGIPLSSAAGTVSGAVGGASVSALPTGESATPPTRAAPFAPPSARNANAERYEWLRSHSWVDISLIKSVLNFGPGYQQTKPDILDAAIDAELARSDGGAA